MNDFRDVAAGRIEDKWIEFVAMELEARPRHRMSAGRVCGAHAAGCIRRVEVHASYLWLLAGAVVALLMR
ncbi:MAG TPA: hypothetical protein VMG60_13230 [Burkholderiaceae bacterium]|nr:hypothetical protein [Burkholderiaceae bacterium]